MPMEPKSPIYSFCLTAFLLNIFSFANFAYSDGFHFSDADIHLYHPNQKAVICWDGNQETMVISSAVKSDDIANFAWVIPVFSTEKPNVTAGDIRVFWDLVAYFMKVEPSHGHPGVYETGGNISSGVTVVESKEIDVFDVTILKADSSADLIDWLNNNGYKIPQQASGMLDKYIAQGNLYFVANKLNLKNKFSKEVDAVKAIDKEVDKKEKALCDVVDSAFSKYGVEGSLYNYNGSINFYVEGRLKEECEKRGISPVIELDLGNGLSIKTVLKFHVALQQIQSRQYYADIYNFDGKDNLVHFYKNGEEITGPRLRLSSLDKKFLTIEDFTRDFKITTPPIGYGVASVNEVDMGIIQDLVNKRSPSYSKLINELLIRNQIINDIAATLQKPCVECMPELMKLQIYGIYYGRNKSLASSTAHFLSGDENVAMMAGFIDWADFNAIKEKQRLGQYLEWEKNAKEKIWNFAREVSGDPGIEDKCRKLNDALGDLSKGVCTPLKIEFKPPRPYYPLEISSLGYGKTKIELYIIGGTSMLDANKILKFDEAKIIDDSLRDKLKNIVKSKDAKYVTRLSYDGDLKGLLSDAVFKEKE